MLHNLQLCKSMVTVVLQCDWLQQLFVSNRSYPFLTCCNSSSFRTGLILSSRVATALHLEQVLSFSHVLPAALPQPGNVTHHGFDLPHRALHRNLDALLVCSPLLCLQQPWEPPSLVCGPLLCLQQESHLPWCVACCVCSNLESHLPWCVARCCVCSSLESHLPWCVARCVCSKRATFPGVWPAVSAAALRATFPGVWPAAVSAATLRATPLCGAIWMHCLSNKSAALRDPIPLLPHWLLSSPYVGTWTFDKRCVDEKECAIRLCRLLFSFRGRRGKKWGLWLVCIVSIITVCVIMHLCKIFIYEGCLLPSVELKLSQLFLMPAPCLRNQQRSY